MGEHAEKSGRDEREEVTRSIPRTAGTAADEEEPAPRRSPVNWRRVKDQVVGIVASVVRWVGLIFAVILVLHVIFTIGDANGSNGIVSWIHGWADTLASGFKDLFTPDDMKLRVLVNYGIAALFWLIVSGILARIIRRVGGVST
jgi:hypothetical protein